MGISDKPAIMGISWGENQKSDVGTNEIDALPMGFSSFFAVEMA